MNSTNAPEPISEESIDLIRGALDELRTDRDQTEAFINETLAALETMRQDVAASRDKLLTHHQNLVKRETEISESLKKIQQREEKLSTQMAEVEAAHEKIEAMRENVAAMQSERDEAVSKLEEAAGELASVEDVINLLELTQAELDEARRQLADAKASLSEQSTTDHDEVEGIREENQRLQLELRKAHRETSRLSAQVAEQAKELEAQKQLWSGEIGSMRDRLKKRAASMKTNGGSDSGIADQAAEKSQAKRSAGTVPTQQRVLPRNKPPASDPVVDAVNEKIDELDQTIEEIED